MAWPVGTRFQDFVDNTVPAFTAAFAHAVQDAIGKVYEGTQTIKALVVDYVGGSAATPVRPTPGTAVPSAAPLRGEFARDAAPAAIANINGGSINNAGAGLSAGWGIQELHRNGAGDYDVTFARKPSGGLTANSVISLSGAVPTVWTKSIDGNGRLKLSITLSGVDLPFDVVAWIF